MSSKGGHDFIRKIHARSKTVDDWRPAAPVATPNAKSRRNRRLFTIREPHSRVLRRKPAAQSIPSMRGSHSEISGMNVTATRNPSIVSSHGHTAMVSSVMPILAMPDAT